MLQIQKHVCFICKKRIFLQYLQYNCFLKLFVNTETYLFYLPLELLNFSPHIPSIFTIKFHIFFVTQLDKTSLENYPYLSLPYVHKVILFHQRTLFVSCNPSFDIIYALYALISSYVLVIT